MFTYILNYMTLKVSVVEFFFFLSLFADLFLQHLDTELSEEDVQKITSGSKAKIQITV